MSRVPKKKSARQLTREIAEVLSRPERTNGGNGGATSSDEAGMVRVTKDRVHEPLINERITRSEPVYVSLLEGRPEEWKLVFTRGWNYSGAQSGRILITLGGTDDPLAALAYSVEYGRPYVHHFWVDPGDCLPWVPEYPSQGGLVNCDGQDTGHRAQGEVRCRPSSDQEVAIMPELAHFQHVRGSKPDDCRRKHQPVVQRALAMTNNVARYLARSTAKKRRSA